MQTVKFTYALKRFYPDLDDIEIDASNITEVLNEIEKKYKGIKSYLVDDQGNLRQHVNIFIDGKMIDDRNELTKPLDSKSEIYIMQALSGG